MTHDPPDDWGFEVDSEPETVGATDDFEWYWPPPRSRRFDLRRLLLYFVFGPGLPARASGPPTTTPVLVGDGSWDRLPSRFIPLARLAGLIAITVTVVLGLVFWVGSCQSHGTGATASISVF